MTIRGYKVVIMDGPAQGWGYTVSIPPDEVIGIAPYPDRHSYIRWMRVPVDSPPELDWPETRLYQRDEIPPADAVREDWLTSEGDLLVQYRVVAL